MSSSTRTSGAHVSLHVAKDASPETIAALLRMAELAHQAWLEGKLPTPTPPTGGAG